LRTRLVRAQFDADSGRWILETEAGQTLRARFFVCSTGPLNLNPAVGRARAGRHRARGQGANHSHGGCHGEALQRRPRARGRLERVRSAHPNGEAPAHRKLFKHQHLAFSEKRSTAGFRLNHQPRWPEIEGLERLQSRLAGSVWSLCRSWYRMENGRIVALFPGFTAEYVRAVRRPNWADYTLA
jgi:hypothetical protein